MNKFNELPQPITSIMSWWKDSQTILGHVTRWSKYLHRNPELRAQTTDVHTLSLSLLGTRIVPAISQANAVPLNLPLLLTSFPVHDLGEPLRDFGKELLKADVHFCDKNAQNDAAEYVAFIEKYGHGAGNDWWEKAFLLQFALTDCPEAFPLRAQTIIRELKASFYQEAYVFLAVEAFDYILYALECWLEKRDEVIVAHVLRNQPGRLDDCCDVVPGLTVMWTTEIQRWCRSLSDALSHVLEESVMFPRKK